MNKLFTKIAALNVGLAMAIGVGVAVGNDSKKATPVHAAGGTFQKITSISDLTSGSKYLIVSESDNLAFDGSLTSIDVTSNTKSVTISSSKITAATDFYFTITSKTGGYSIKGSGGYYIGSTSSNANELKNGTSDSYTNTITWDSTNSCFVIRGTNSYLVYNSTSGQTRFRYFKPGTCGNGVGTGAYHKISLFKEAAAKTPSTLSSSGHKTSFSNGEAFFYGGTLTVTYTDKTSSTVNPTSYKYGDSGINPTSAGTAITTSDTLSYSTHNDKYIYVLYSENNTTVYTSYQITVSQPATYTSVTVSGGDVQGTEKGSAYIQCSASATGTNIPASPSFTWYVTETNAYGTTTSVTDKASIDNTGKVTFLDSCTVYVWALAPDGSTHNTSGYAAAASDLTDPKGSEANPYTVPEARAIAATLNVGSNNGKLVCVRGVVSGTPKDNQYGSTFDITGGDETMKAYSIAGAQSSNSSASGYVNDGYTVVVKGAIINHSTGGYEVGYDTGYQSALISSTAPATPEITALSLDTTNVTLEFELNASFSYSGLVVTATVDGVSGVSIVSGDYSVSTPDMTTEGQKTVTVTYTGSDYDHESTISASYTITVIIPSADATIALIGEIGTVEYTQSCYNKIAAARSSYNALPAASQANVNNYSTLEAAETSFASLKTSAVNNVISLITNIGTVTLSSGTAILNAETAYSALLEGDLGKSLVSNYSDLTAARSAYNTMVSDKEAADEVTALIAALPAASSITDQSHHSDIVAARTAYDNLTNDQKTYVTADTLQKLVDCENADKSFIPTIDGVYNKVTNLSQLVDGAVVIITNADGTVAMSTTQNSNNRGITAGASAADGAITIEKNATSSIQVFTIESYSSNSDTIAAFKTLNGTSDGYIYAAGTGSSNYLRTKDSVDDSAKFTITLSNGTFDAVAASSNRNYLRYNSNNSIFSCYNDTQNHIAIYVKQAVDPTKVASVSINPSQLTIGVGSTAELEAFIYPETAIDKMVTWESDNTDVVTVNNGVITGVATGGPVTITVTTHDGNKTATCVVTVIEMSIGFYYKISNASELNEGDTIIFAAPLEGTTNPRVGTNSISNKKLPTSSTSSDNHWTDSFGNDSVESIRIDSTSNAWTVSKDGDNFKFADGSSNYLHMAGDKTDLSTIDSASAGNSWSLSATGINGGMFIIANASYTSRALSYQVSGQVLGAYATSNFGEGKTEYRTLDIYKLVTITSSDKLSGLTCTGNGSYTANWASISTAFSNLSKGVKAYYKHASYAKSGFGLDTVVTSTNDTNDDIAQFVAKYDDVVSKYDVTDFIGRQPNKQHNPRILFGSMIQSNNSVVVIIVVSIISSAAIGGYFFLRKRKED